jgi:hypothetical protein
LYCEVFDPRGSRVETGWFKKGDEPKDECKAHVAVEFCTVSNSVAGQYCPEEHRTIYALVDATSREWFVQNIIVRDSEYTCRETTQLLPFVAAELPYFASIIPEGMFAGKTKEDSETPYPFNRACGVHTEPVPEDETEDGEENGEETGDGELSDEDKTDEGITVEEIPGNEESDEDENKSGNENEVSGEEA